LTRRGIFEKHSEVTFSYAHPQACRACPIKTQCTKSDYRRIERWENEAIIEQIAERVERRPQIIKRRKGLVEHPFGTIKFWRGQGALLTRGRIAAQAELSLSALAYNLCRVITLLGVSTLVAAIAAR
jgi:hypothetical protein